MWTTFHTAISQVILLQLFTAEKLTMYFRNSVLHGGEKMFRNKHRCGASQIAPPLQKIAKILWHWRGLVVVVLSSVTSNAMNVDITLMSGSSVVRDDESNRTSVRAEDICKLRIGAKTLEIRRHIFSLSPRCRPCLHGIGYNKAKARITSTKLLRAFPPSAQHVRRIRSQQRGCPCSGVLSDVFICAKWSLVKRVISSVLTVLISVAFPSSSSLRSRIFNGNRLSHHACKKTNGPSPRRDNTLVESELRSENQHSP